MRLRSNLLPAAAAALAAALPGQAMEAVEDDRNLMQSEIEWKECVQMHVSDCIAHIKEEINANPGMFSNLDADLFEYDISNVRESGQDDYNLVGLRTNNEENKVVGILGDGMVFYPWDWCHSPTDCYPIGPWDCDVGTPLNVEQCCNLILASVPDPDMNGNMLECYADYPIGSVSNPVDTSRVVIHINSNNIVVHPPKNH